MKTILKTILVLVLSATFLLSCDNDSNPSPNDVQCTHDGVTYFFPNTTNTFIDAADLTLEYYTSTSNGPEVEVYLNSDPGHFNFVTTAVVEGTTDSNTVNYNGNTYNNSSITCQRGLAAGNTTGASVGDEFRWDIVNGSVEFEICMTVISVTYGYVDADGDGCGSQTISYTFGVLNNVDSNDSDPNAC